MTVVKRDGRIVPFDRKKIEIAILKAMEAVGEIDEHLAKEIAAEIENHYTENSQLQISLIEKNVFDLLCHHGSLKTARAYESFRSVREFQRNTKNSVDQELKELISDKSEYWNEENSNKNSLLVSTKRDYIAGIVSKDLASRYIFSADVIEAHNEGIIHQHDMDYSLQSLHNCELVNLEDMLQNGTVINGVAIDKPHKLLTATTITTQIITSVTSSSYGGCSICLAHLAPFVRSSYEAYIKKYENRGHKEEDVIKFAKEDLAKEITDSVQTFNYQLNSMTNVNGQSPFLSVYMYTNEEKEYKEELAMLIEEFLKQRIQGMKNEKGQYYTIAFPKLLYVLDEDNMKEDAPYYYLTKLAVKCTAKRLVPDYISAKVMRKCKGGVWSCMGKCKCSPCKIYVNRANGCVA